ncbi:MAG: hypothetical protein KUG82_06720 [Pseudomonadales bacterium]|nr:hypothetical protein [Pseudomonadales bacterium]
MTKSNEIKSLFLSDFKNNILTNGLGKTLLLRFILLSVIPVTLVAWISMEYSAKIISSNQTNSLVAVTKAKHAHLTSYFNSVSTNLRLLSESENTLHFIDKLNLAYKKSGTSLKEFVGGYQWSELEDKYGTDFLMRSNSKEKGAGSVLETRVETKTTSAWLLGKTVFDREYINHRGQSVIGVALPV